MEELCYDYSGQVQKSTSSLNLAKLDETTDDEDIETIKLDNMIRSNQMIKNAKCKICLCGSKKCRGYLPLDETLFKK